MFDTIRDRIPDIADELSALPNLESAAGGAGADLPDAGHEDVGEAGPQAEIDRIWPGTSFRDYCYCY